MLLSEVAKLDPLDRFIYWIKERHSIYLRRESDKPKPWTDDEVLQNFFFTNPYRENDKVTVWFRENIRNPLRSSPSVIFATIAFRWFNLPMTGYRLLGQPYKSAKNLLINWDPKQALRRLSAIRNEGGQVFTGAFMINSPAGRPKLEAIVDRIDAVWKDRRRLIAFFEQPTVDNIRVPITLELAHKRLTEYDGLGGFMAYEVVTDLRHTKYLANASDIDTWCNPGPGCIRGLYRILGKEFPKGNNATSPPVPKDFQEQMLKLLKYARKKLRGFPRLEMREIEHSLCETDKYERARLGDGKLKRRYNGRG